MYNQGFYITGNYGNNAFSFKERKDPKIWVPPMGDELVEGDKIAFEDFEDGELKSCVGLKNFVKMDLWGTPGVVVDNHNHVFYFWHEWGAKNATLVHVDQHKDTREPNEWFKNDAFKYTNEVLNVGNYIPPALECGMVKEVVSITGSEGPWNVRKGNVILNLDLDFFVSEMEVDFEKTREFLWKQGKVADFVTVATSPFFIDQGKALEVLRRLLV